MKGQREDRRFRAAVLLLFTASGATGLVLEVVWTRLLGTVLGNTVYAASTVLTAFMLGLALGSMVLGRVADRSRRPLLLYGCLEAGVGIYALCFPLLVAVSSAFYVWFYRAVEPGPVTLTAVRCAVSLLLLLPPTVLMGGTLAVLGHHLGTGRREPGREVGYLYAANTTGAVAGCFLAGFVLLEAIGVRGSLFAAGGTAVGVGLLAVALGWRARVPETTARPQPSVTDSALRRKAQRKAGKKRPLGNALHEIRESRPALAAAPLSAANFRLLLVAFALTGFCALAYEVLFTRVLIFLVLTSVYSFALMLTSFLVGLALGSLLSTRLIVPRVRRPMLWFGVIEVLVGAGVLGSVAVLARLERIDMHMAQWFEWAGSRGPLLLRFADAFVVLFVPTLLMGAAFPIVTVGCLRGAEGVGRRVGLVYAANTIGCVLGSFAAGFLLLPALGTHYSLLSVVAINMAVGVVLIWQAMPRSPGARLCIAAPAAAAAVAAFLLTPADVFYDTINTFHHPSRIVFIDEHPTGTVTVHDEPNGDRAISVSGVGVAGTDFMLRSTQKLQGYLPLCLHPNPRRVVQIGFGSGETARVGLEFGVHDYTVVEICPAVFDAGELFTAINRGSHRDPRIRRLVMDGKNFALLSAEKFDVVMNDSVYPGSCGSSALYTVDHFRNCRQRLADGGLFSCWLPLDLRPGELRMVLRSFQEVFPHTSFWLATNCLNKHALILGSLEPLQTDLARIKAVVERPDVAADLRAIAINDVYGLLDCHLCDESAVARMVENDPLNTDDRPRLEFSCANRVNSEAGLLATLTMLSKHHAPIAPYVVHFADEPRDRAELARRFTATGHILLAQIGQLMGIPGVRREQMQLARIANPNEAHVASCDEELEREIRDLKEALAARPTQPELARRLAGKLWVASRENEAAPLYEQLARAQPRPPEEVFVRLADIAFRGGETSAAESTLNQCLALWPQSAEARDRLAGIYLRTGRADLAEQRLAEAVRLSPGNPIYRAHYEKLKTAGGLSTRTAETATSPEPVNR